MSDGVRTTCPYCGVGCGILVRRSGTEFELAGDPAHPSNRGRLCSKGSALLETLGPEGRLLHPQVGGQRVSWDEALSSVATGLADVLREHGPEAVAFYVSGQLLTEDYYVANKLMKGFIGGANIDTNSRLCMASAVAGHKRAFGADVVPGCYEDFELADLIVLVGSNAAWCHPVLHQRIAAAKERRPELTIVVVDPRRTPTSEISDLHLPLRAGTDVWLFNGLAAFLFRHGVTDADFLQRHTEGSEAALEVAETTAGSIEGVAAACGLTPDLVRRFYQLFARTERTVTAFSQGINQSSSGTDKVSSIINCHLLTGRIGRPGMGPFSLTGQPNAMGGREVGGLANALAAHMELEVPEHRRVVQEFWASPRIASRAGLKAVELFDAVHAGRIKALWIMATNPVVSLPDADRVREALGRCPLVIVSDCMERTDTTPYAHVLLPAAGWGEKEGTVTSSERRISRQRAFVPPPGEARPDWWIVSAVARRMGFDAPFAYGAPHQIFSEHARLSGLSGGARAFDIGGLAGLDAERYSSLEPIQWPVPAPGGPGCQRLFASGRFYHGDQKARLVPTLPRGPGHATDGEFPLVLNTGRVRDHWHTMTRTGRSARLSSHSCEPYVDLHGADALVGGVQPGDLARVTTRWGALVARVRSSGEVARGTAFVPMHWNDQFASDARVGALVNPIVDPVSGEPEFKHTPARIEPFHVAWHGFVLTRAPRDVRGLTWWALARGNGLLRYEIAGRSVPPDWCAFTQELLGCDPSGYLDYRDAAAGVYRAARVVDGRLEACAFFSPRADLPSRAWLSSLFARARLEEAERAMLLAAAPATGMEDSGPIVCSCYGVGRETIVRAVARHALRSPREVGAHLRAGTNCGSCVAEIKTVISEAVLSERGRPA